jgi:predicted nucleotidyltransferase/DNA-binding XRE family transcriptional regulator
VKEDLLVNDPLRQNEKKDWHINRHQNMPFGLFKKLRIRHSSPLAYNKGAMELKAVRLEKKLRQAQAAKLLDISLRSYSRYENDEKRKGTTRYQKYLSLLLAYQPFTETKGILSLKEIKTLTATVLAKHPVSFCILFGSYAKGTPREDSDVDLLILTSEKGLAFYGLVEELRQTLHKKIDLLDANEINENKTLLLEILTTGIRLDGSIQE